MSIDKSQALENLLERCESLSKNTQDTPFVNEKHSGMDNSATEELSGNTVELSYVKIWKPSKLLLAGLCIDASPSLQKFLTFSNSVADMIENAAVFYDIDECVDRITEITNTKSVLIVADSVFSPALSCINGLRQVNCIYIYDDRSEAPSRMELMCSKVRGVLSELQKIIDDTKRRFYWDWYGSNSITVHVFQGNNPSHEIRPTFLYHRFIEEILLKLSYGKEAQTDFFNFYRDQCSQNHMLTNDIEEIEKDYNQHSPIWWYREKPSLHSIINRVLRERDFSCLMRMRYFLKDLYECIKQVHSQVTAEEKRIFYRAFSVRKKDFDKLLTIENGYVCFDGFLSMTTNENSAELDISRICDNSDPIECIALMKIDALALNCLYAPVSIINERFSDENEILFTFNTIFKVESVSIHGHIAQVFLSHVGKQDILSEVPDDIFPAKLASGHPNPWVKAYYQFGRVFMKKSKESKRMYFPESNPEIICIPSLTERRVSMWGCRCFGTTYKQWEDYSPTILFRSGMWRFGKNVSSSNQLTLADVYVEIGRLNAYMNDYLEAISCYKNALQIQQLHLPKYHPSLVTTYMSIGQAHEANKHYGFSLDYYYKALKIQQRILPSNYVFLSMIHIKVGEMYLLTGNNCNALQHYNEAREIQERLLPSIHESLLMIQTKIDQILNSMNQCDKRSQNAKSSLANQSKSPLLSFIEDSHIPEKQPSLSFEHSSKAQGNVETCQEDPCVRENCSWEKQAVANKIGDKIFIMAPYRGYAERMNTGLICSVGPSFYSFNLGFFDPLYMVIEDLFQAPISLCDCVETVRARSEVRNLIIDISSITLDSDRDMFLGEVSDVDHVEFIYLLGRGPLTKKERNALRKRFDKVRIFCDNAQQLVTHWMLDVVDECREKGTKCAEALNMAAAREYFEHGLNLHSHLSALVSDKRPNIGISGQC